MKKQIVLHTLLWLAVPVVYTLFSCYMYVLTNIRQVTSQIGTSAYISTTLLYTGSMLAAGIPVFYLAAAIFRQPRRYFRWILVLVIPPLAVILFSPVIDAFTYFFTYYVLRFYIMAGLAVFAGLFYGMMKRNKALKNANQHAQLELVTSRTNPHFLFNTINNIDALIIKDPERASDYLNKLSGMLRFVLYDATTTRIPLKAEIDYIVKYINLEKIRSVNPDFVRFSTQGHIDKQQVAPMTFIPVLENAFKHMDSKTTTDAIVANLHIDQQHLLFICTNRHPDKPTGEGLGIGLLKQRLDLIYGNRYQMNMHKTDTHYQVTIKLDLDAH